MTVALLDVNVLLALAWPNHTFHQAARAWYDEFEADGWATCTLTELGFIRMSSNPAFVKTSVSPSDAAGLLQGLIQRPHHSFWHSPTASQAECFLYARGHQQVNDAWLVQLARQYQGAFATFDARCHVHDPSGEIVILIPQQVPGSRPMTDGTSTKQG